MTASKTLLQRVRALIDSHPVDGWREFLEEIAEDVRARLECLDDEEAEDE